VAHSGQLGLIKILGESSIGTGVRRVEALVGTDAFRYLARESVLVSQLTEQLKTRREDLPDRIASLVGRLREAERDLDRLRSAQILGGAAELAGHAEDAGPVALVAYQVPDGTTADDIRKLALDVRGRFPQERPAVVMIAGVPADRPAVVVAVNEAARALGLAAGALVRSAAQVLGGGGGGRDDIAQGGGAPQGDQASQAISGAFEAVRAVVRDMA
jgi:alanyl-tRNA synthetase